MTNKTRRETAETLNHADSTEHTGHTDHTEHPDYSEHTDYTDHTERTDHADHPDYSEHKANAERRTDPGTAQRAGRISLRNQSHSRTVRLTASALFMAMNIVMSSFSVPVPGGHLYLNDVVICLASILLGPVEAFAVGGIGAFLGDLLFYPAPMFVSLVTHGIQAIVISLFSRKVLKEHPVLSSGIGVSIGAVIMVAGYTLGRAYGYSTPEYALLKLPFQILQAVVGAIGGMLLCWKCGLRRLFQKLAGEE